MRIVLLGPPGAGKGSLASLCHTRLGVAHVSTGEIFRQEMGRNSALGRHVRRYVTNGRLVPDGLVVRVMTKRLSDRALTKGFVCDGFPRTREQAAGLDAALARRRQPLDGAVYLTSPGPLLVRRLSGRRVCPKCGANYHVRTMRPRRAGQCDGCRAALVTRKDDEASTIRKRLSIDRRASAPLLAYYREQGILSRVDGRGHIETVFKRTMQLFRRKAWLKTPGHD